MGERGRGSREEKEEMNEGGEESRKDKGKTLLFSYGLGFFLH